MKRSRVVLAVLLVAVGAIFIGQGTGVLAGSGAMVGDSRWAWIGAALVLAGIVMVGLPLARSQR